MSIDIQIRVTEAQARALMDGDPKEGDGQPAYLLRRRQGLYDRTRGKVLRMVTEACHRATVNDAKREAQRQRWRDAR